MPRRGNTPSGGNQDLKMPSLDAFLGTVQQRTKAPCRWGNSSPCSVALSHVDDATLNSGCDIMSPKWHHHFDDAPPPPPTSDISPNRWNLHEDGRSSNSITSPMLPSRRKEIVGKKEDCGRMERLSNRKNLPNTLRALPY